MSHASFVLLVVVGVLFSITVAHRCPENQEWTSCGSACPPSCNWKPAPCTLQCVIGCQCKKGFLLHSSGRCVSPEQC